MYQIQEPVPLHRSLLWQLQQASYQQLGMTAWSADQTPSYITSNPDFSARTAAVIAGLLADMAGGAPVTIVELGAGSGRFTFRLLAALTAQLAACPVPVADWRLVMTDVAPSLITAWKAHPRLKPFAQAGQLDFARFDVSDPQPLRLQGGEVVSQGPWIVLASYLWDSVPQDAYEVGEGAVKALDIGLLCEHEAPDGSDPAGLMGQLKLLQRRRAPDPLPPRLQALLAARAQRLKAPTAVLVPTAAAACIDWLAARGPTVVLSADKGISAPHHLIDGEALPVSIHGGSLSLTVDFEALEALLPEAWCLRGGDGSPLFLHHLAALGLPPEAISHGAMAFHQAFSPGQGYALYRLCRSIAAEGIAPSLERILSVLALTRSDPDVLTTFAAVLRSRLSELDSAQCAALAEALRAAAQHTYALPGDEPVDALIGELATAIGAPDVAEAAWARVLAWEPSAEALHGRAVALSMLGRPQEALDCVEQAIAIARHPDQRARLQQWAAALAMWTGGDW